MILPVIYDEIHWKERWKVREEYVKLQEGLCYHCKKPLSGEPSKEVLKMKVTPRLFPENFFKHPIHLHHSHETGLTLGAVHNYCNAVLWQHFGE